jgi:hypothetical protein
MTKNFPIENLLKCEENTRTYEIKLAIKTCTSHNKLFVQK